MTGGHARHLPASRGATPPAFERVPPGSTAGCLALHAFMAEQATPPAPDLVDLPDSDEEVREPPRYEVLMHNDHYTTMDFVVSVLERIFYKSPSEATRIMLAIHRHGAGRCGVYTREVAEMKVEQVHRLARKNEFPLRCSVQEAP